MSLVNYVEPVSVGSAFIGLGSLLMAGVMATIVYKFYNKAVQWWDIKIEREIKYEIVEEAYLDKVAAKRGVDLTKEMVKRKMLEENKPDSMRKKLEEEVYKEMFGDNKK